MGVQVLERICDLKRYVSGHVYWNRLEITASQELLEVAPCHVLRYDAVFILVHKVLLHPGDIRAALDF